jgi:hypothetical protein
MELGWMDVLVPDDFDRMGEDEIVLQFEGDGPRNPADSREQHLGQS